MSGSGRSMLELGVFFFLVASCLVLFPTLSDYGLAIEEKDAPW